MGAGPTLPTRRSVLRRWVSEDRVPFAVLNADPAVARYLNGPVTAPDRDAFVDRIEAGFDAEGFGLWAVEVADTRQFIGFTGLSRPRFDAPFMPAVEIGRRLDRST